MQTKYKLSQSLQNAAFIARQLKDYFSIDGIQYIHMSREYSYLHVSFLTWQVFYNIFRVMF